MNILAIETSGKSFSLAVSINGKLKQEVFWSTGLNHSEKLVPALDKLLKKTKLTVGDIDKIAVSTGPGSFTGIRVGLSCARAIAQSMEIPLVGINTLEILRAGIPLKGDYAVIPAIDALRNEVFVLNKKTGRPEIQAISDFVSGLRKSKAEVCVAGSAALTYFKELTETLNEKLIFGSDEMNYPRAGILAGLADKLKGSKYDRIEPLYIRRSWAEDNSRNKK